MRQKNGSERTITLPATVSEILSTEFFNERKSILSRSRAERLQEPQQALFISESGQRINRKNVARIVTELVARADCGTITIHHLRRVGFSIMKEGVAAKGADAKPLLADLAGHASAETTMSHYVGPFSSAAERMPSTLALAANDASTLEVAVAA